MFETNESRYSYVFKCKNEEYEGKYSFVAGPDDDPDEIAQLMFYDEFELYPTVIIKVSSEELKDN